ncbi:methyl-CpG-binding domain protein [Medicago truncatula]|uniref:Methyl-CpG-binding domain protein n=1 Tax=Medicago truncatula TaxID=3880 RepID=G7KM19_MEDTR|nr:methyl-CpG-binding domain protein [Medicago truncatula]
MRSWDISTLIGRQVAHTDRTMIFTCGVLTLQLIKGYPADVLIKDYSKLDSNYITPIGKNLRTRNEIATYLKGLQTLYVVT